MMIFTIKRRIMLGVYFLYLLRKLKVPLIRECVIFVILMAGLFYFVSVSDVWANMLASGNFYGYFLMAFSHTNLLVQLIIIFSAFLVFFFVRNITIQAILKNRLA